MGVYRRNFGDKEGEGDKSGKRGCRGLLK